MVEIPFCLPVFCVIVSACTQKVSKSEVSASNLPEVKLVAHVASSKADGKPYAVVGIAAGAASGGPDLEGVLLHWACVSRQGQEWQQPPPGWHTDPDYSHVAGELPTDADSFFTEDTCTI